MADVVVTFDATSGKIASDGSGSERADWHEIGCSMVHPLLQGVVQLASMKYRVASNESRESCGVHRLLLHNIIATMRQFYRSKGSDAQCISDFAMTAVSTRLVGGGLVRLDQPVRAGWVGTNSTSVRRKS